MLKKILCCAAVVLLVAGCDTFAGTDDAMNGANDRVFFAFDQSELSSATKATLDQQIAALKTNSTKVRVEGYCDDRGTREYNLALGERRAMAVKNYLVAGGISAKRITTISYGKERPAVMGSGEIVWQQNRRALTIGITADAKS